MNNDDSIETSAVKVQYTCDQSLSTSSPITFNTSDSFLDIGKWKDVTRGTIELNFKTSEKVGETC